VKKVYSASVTPLTDDGRIDKKSLGRLIEFDIAGGIDGFFFLGTTGEWFALSTDMKRELIGSAVESAKGRAAILAGVNGAGFKSIIENIHSLSEFDLSAYVFQYPGGWAAPTDPVAFAHAVADEADKPIYLYHIPGANNIHLHKEQFEAILQHPNIKGLKNSSDSLRTRKELLVLRDRIDFELFEGQEWVVDESLLLGCDGALVGLASLDAKILKGIAQAVDSGDVAEARKKQGLLLSLFDGIYGPDLATIWSGQKYALTLLGVLDSWKTLVPVNASLSADQKDRIERCVSTYRSYLE